MIMINIIIFFQRILPYIYFKIQIYKDPNLFPKIHRLYLYAIAFQCLYNIEILNSNNFQMKKGLNKYLDILKGKFDQVTSKFTTKQQASSDSYIDNIPREEILFSQYPLQKYGKNLKQQEFRTFRIEKDKLLQCNNNSLQKQLPFPINIFFQCKDPQQDQNIDKKVQENQDNPWSETMKDYKYRLYLKFQQRQPVWIYFKNKIAAMEIATKITAIKDKTKFKFEKAYNKFVDVQRNAFIIQMLKKTKAGKQTKSKITSRGILTYGILTKLSDEEMIKQLIQTMYMKVMKQSKKYNFGVLFKTIYTFREDLGQAQIKFWINGEIGYKGKLQSSGKRYTNNIKEYKFVQPNSILFQDVESRSTISIQLISTNIRYRCDRFNVQDLRKKGALSLLGIVFKSGQKKLILSLQCQFKKLDPESYQKENFSNMFEITPQHYPLINQVFYHNISNPVQLPDSLAYMHKHHKALNKQIQRQSKLFQPHQFSKIFQLLNIQELINKFFQSYPFNQYIMVQNRGSFVYEYITSKSEKIKYWDVQQIIWQIGSKREIPLGLRRLFNALKCFDQNPRVIFSQNLGYLCIRVLSTCTNLTQQKWPHGSFKQFSIGSEAMAFFVILSLLKMYNGIFIRHGLDKRTIQNDSLLFHYSLKTVMSKHYTALMSTQLNFQALFGQEYANLFSKILPQGLFQNVLQISIIDYVENNNKPKEYNYILIAVFLTVIEFTCNFQSPFISGQHYLLFLQYYFNNLSMSDHLHFMSVLMSKIQLIKQCAVNSIFLQLRDNMKKFYSQELMGGGNSLGEVGLQLYDIFSSYKYKNSSDMRKMYIILDKIQLGNEFLQSTNSNFLLVYLYQGKQKIYSHTFQKPNLSQLRHTIEIKLNSLEEVTVLMQIVNNPTTFSFKFSPFIIPSNYFLQQTQSLKVSTKIMHENRYVCYQICIKDNCQVQFLDHRFPQNYIKIFHLPPLEATYSLDQTKLTRSQLIQASLKQDAAFCSSYTKAYRMSENNFCVLYGKLGWYGCHYILPQQRLLDIRIPLRKHDLHGLSISYDQSESKIFKNALQIMRYCRLIYGRAIIPYPIRQNNKIYTTFLKNNIVVQYCPHNNDTPIFYDSVNSLTTYVLQNFRFSNHENFLQFYRKFMRLPLIKYLTYQPSIFMPVIQFDFWWQEKKTKVIFTGSIKGKRMKSNYSVEEISRMSRDFYLYKVDVPDQLEFIYPYYEPNLHQNHRVGFCDLFMSLDNLFTVLKWNIIDQSLLMSQKSRSLQKSQSDAFRFRIRTDRPKFPNVHPHQLFMTLFETKQTVQLTLELLVHHTRNNENLKYFVNFGHINGKWKKIAILCGLKGQRKYYYYVEEWQTRSKHILNAVDVIVEEQFYVNNKSETIPQIKFTDEELEKNKQHVGLQLSAYI